MAVDGRIHYFYADPYAPNLRTLLDLWQSVWLTEDSTWRTIFGHVVLISSRTYWQLHVPM